MVGGAFPSVRVYTTDNKEKLREFKGHKGYQLHSSTLFLACRFVIVLCFRDVRVAKFLPTKTHIFSGSHDKTVRYWDLSSGSEVSCLRGHTVSSSNFVWH